MLPVNLFPQDVIEVGNLRDFLPSLTESTSTPTGNSTSVARPGPPNESCTIAERGNQVSLDIGSSPVPRELHTTARETTVAVEDEDAPVKNGNARKKWYAKAAKIGATIGVTAVAGALIGLLIGIAGGPPGMAFGAAAGLAIGGGTGAGGLIAHEIAKHMKKKKAAQKEAATGTSTLVDPSNPTIN